MLNPSPLLVFADDWGRHPSSCQHIIRRLLPERTVTWVNTIGTRAPKLDIATFRRGLGKLCRWFRPAQATEEPLPQNLTVHHPKMWPWFTRKLDRTINRKLLLRALKPLIARMPEPPIAVTTLPIVADLMGELAIRHWVYYCVDDFSQWPGLDRKTMARMEAILVEKADVLIAVSENLRERLWTMGRSSELLTHGVDVERWAAPANKLENPLGYLPQPCIVFWGVIDRRMDSRWLLKLADSLARGTVVLIGPEQEPDPELRAHERITHLGAKPFTELPAIAQTAKVLVMPYADLPVTRAMQPLKLKEYLATGLPVVVRDLPANREWRDSLDIVADPDAFVSMVMARIETGLPREQQLARIRLANESWESKAQRFAELISLKQQAIVETPQ